MHVMNVGDIFEMLVTDLVIVIFLRSRVASKSCQQTYASTSLTLSSISPLQKLRPFLTYRRRWVKEHLVTWPHECHLGSSGVIYNICVSSYKLDLSGQNQWIRQMSFYLIPCWAFYFRSRLLTQVNSPQEVKIILLFRLKFITI